MGLLLFKIQFYDCPYLFLPSAKWANHSFIPAVKKRLRISLPTEASGDWTRRSVIVCGL